jgi:glycosyltransferase involved in cell wall biosynthesis
MIHGFTVVRNALSLDFCLELCVKSLLPVCDTVTVCDSDSTDGTSEFLAQWAERESKLRVINRPWSNPCGHLGWLLDWMQWAQARLPQEGFHLYLDADEVLDPAGYNVLRQAPPGQCYWFYRANYWRDIRHMAPHGTVCSHRVARFGPHYLPMHSDEIHDGVQFPKPEPEMRVKAVRHPALKIHHLGFLRHREAMLSKVESNLRYFFGSGQDERLIRAIKEPDRHWTEFCPFKWPLLDAPWEPPEIALEWLEERNAL